MADDKRSKVTDCDTKFTRRGLMKTSAALVGTGAMLSAACKETASNAKTTKTSTATLKSGAPHPSGARWISTRKGAEWVDTSAALSLKEGWHGNVMVDTGKPLQIVDGFGGCFNELGWDALQILSEKDQADVMADFFAPKGVDTFGLGFTHCRMPVAANDFARDWYSYNDTDGDFAMENFSIARDKTSLIPYIKMAQGIQPDVKVWGSPWSPPTWMKTNRHYAQNTSEFNDLKPEQKVEEGEDGFIMEDRYLKAYALYFRKYIEAYRAEGISIEMVMPQNEFNSNQGFPSCCWKPESLARFVAELDTAMKPMGVDIFFGTLERPDVGLFDRVMANQAAARAIKGVGFQWAGRAAAPFIHFKYPDLKIYQTEQECGDGKNDWRFARYGWDMMRDYMRAGCNVYDYWNMALIEGGRSTWGWGQNSLIVVNPETQTYRFTPDYYMLKHVAHFVRPGARHVIAHSWTGHDNALAFVNPDGSEVMVIQNDQPDDIEVEIGIKGQIAVAKLPPNSLNTITL